MKKKNSKKRVSFRIRILRPIITCTSFLFRLLLKNKLLSLILFVATAIRVIGLFPHDLYNADEAYIRDFSGRIFFDVIAKGDFDPHTFKYGTFIFYVGAIPYLPVMLGRYILELTQSLLLPVGTSPLPSFQVFITNLGPFHNDYFILWIQRFSIAIIGVASVYLLYKITTKLFNKHIALLASLLLAVSPLHARDSHFLTTDVPFTFFILLAIYCLLHIFQTGKLKWYILSGLVIGFSSTVRYFPIAIVAYPIAVLLDPNKNRRWVLKSIVGFLSIPIGVFIGVPHLIISHENQLLFQDEMARYVLPWYQTPISTFAIEFARFIATLGASPLPPIHSLFQAVFKPVYVTLMYFHGLGPLPLIISILGIFVAFFRYPLRTLFLLIVPTVLFIYISAYIPAKYDRLGIPLIPFLAIFAAVFLHGFWLFLRRQKIQKSPVFYLGSILIVISYPLFYSFSSSVACSTTHPFDESVTWIDKNIPAHSVIAFKTHMPFPSKPLTGIEITPQRNFYLEEVRLLKADYAFINATTALTYFMGSLPNDFFVPPKDIYKNYYVPLSLYEYHTRAIVLHEIKKPEMCTHPNLVYFKLPKPVPEAKQIIKAFDFSTKKDLLFWHLSKYSVPSKKVTFTHTQKEGNRDKGALMAQWESFQYVPPRIVSEKIAVKPNTVYTFSGWIKADKTLKEYNLIDGIDERDGFLRIDFYEDTAQQTNLPGNVVALSPRVYGKPTWRKVTISAKSPSNASFMTLSLASNGIKPETTFFFDDLVILGS